jgi:hypothetical protein
MGDLVKKIFQKINSDSGTILSYMGGDGTLLS